MKLLPLLPILAIVAVAGCISQTGLPGQEAPAGGEGPGTTEPATEPLAPPSSEGIGFVLVTPQPGQHIFTNKVNVVIAPVNFTITPPGGEPVRGEAHFHIFLDDRSYVIVANNSYTFENVAEGDHTLKVEVHNNDHSSLSPPLVRILYFTTGPAAPSGPTGCRYDNPPCPLEFACEDNVCVSRGKQIGSGY